MSATATVQGSDHMPSAIFDTLAYAKKLKAAGFTEQQAEGQAEAMYEMIDQKLATKQDIYILKRDLRETANMLTIRFGGMIAAAVMIIAVLIKIL